MKNLRKLALAAAITFGSALPGFAATLGHELTVSIYWFDGSSFVTDTSTATVVDDTSNPEIQGTITPDIGTDFLYAGESFDLIDDGIVITATEGLTFQMFVTGWDGVLTGVSSSTASVLFAEDGALGQPEDGISDDGSSVWFSYRNVGAGTFQIDLSFAPTTPPGEVPLPAGVWLLGTGMAAFSLARRRRKS